MSGWYYAKTSADPPRGPYGETALQQMIASGRIPPDTMLYHPSHAPKWIRADSYAASQPPPPKPEPKPPPKQREIRRSVDPPAPPKSLREVKPTDPRRPMAGQPVQQPVSNQTIVQHHYYQQQRQSNTIPVLLNMFLFPGLGQVVQNRPGPAIIISVLWIVSLLGVFFVFGCVTTPIIWLVSIIDAAVYEG